MIVCYYNSGEPLSNENALLPVRCLWAPTSANERLYVSNNTLYLKMKVIEFETQRNYGLKLCVPLLVCFLALSSGCRAMPWHIRAYNIYNICIIYICGRYIS